jgi:sterol desaturase/sphingolipid hydroxylase (fatty acid hydroxylase superfamily)
MDPESLSRDVRETGGSTMSNRRGIVSLLIGCTFLALVAFEALRPLRRRRESKSIRLSRNIAFAGIAAGLLNLSERPLVQPLARVVQRRRWGLLYARRLPHSVHLVLAVLLLDYTLYLWHVLAHRVGWIWRFHLVHHIDHDLDVSTGLRFHVGEMALTVPWRLAQILVIGVPPEALQCWQNLLFTCVLFHHSNVRLPIAVERRLVRLFVTPRMHGIHHSIVPDEMNSNWSSGLTVWDWLHGTLRLNVPQQAITIGVPAYLDSADVRLGYSIELPFFHQRPWHLLPGDSEPPPHAATRTPSQLEP